MSFVTRNPSIDLIIGPMFSGKTTELHRRLNICKNASFSVIYINSVVDTRAEFFSTHNSTLKQNNEIKYVKAQTLTNLVDECKGYDVIGIDEAQFFPDLILFCRTMCEEYKKKVIVCGLNSDFKRHPFGEILSLVSICDTITKVESFCSSCRKDGGEMVPAIFSKRIMRSENTILVGGTGEYIPVCRSCYFKE